MSFTKRNGRIRTTENEILWSFGDETVSIQAWGHSGIRVRSTLAQSFLKQGWALDTDLSKDIEPRVTAERVVFENGSLGVSINTQGTIVFFLAGNESDIILQETVSPRAYANHGRQYLRTEGECVRASVHFKAQEGEKFFGLGQHQNGFLDQSNTVTKLEQRNTEVAIPFLISSKGYGFLWNNPAVGRVELSRSATSWYANRTKQIDYVVFGGETVKGILSEYADATGHSPMMPYYATGFWQSKLRYQSQEELLKVAREYKRRKLPLSVIVIDFFHWKKMGEWKFDEEKWPNPEEMIAELKSYGVETMVSVWPTVNPDSENIDYLREHGLLVGSERGIPVTIDFSDTESPRAVHFYLYDPSTAEGRNFIWNKVKENYGDKGIKLFWLDACEPEIRPQHLDNLRIAIGNMEEVGSVYPKLHQKAFYEGLKSEGIAEPLTLTRSAWAGSQKYGTAVWSGDIESTFEALQAQVPAGLNMGLSGFPWWTTDIGGFFAGNTKDPYFRELVIRWFQFALFCPIFRLHGFRESSDFKTGGPNEVWSFGEEAYEIIKGLLELREIMRPYIVENMREAHRSGTPIMRPMFVDYPADPLSWEVEDQFMFGPELLVAPVLYRFSTERVVYLPHGTRWVSAWDHSRVFEGGQKVTVPAPLNRIPVFSPLNTDFKIFDGK